MTPEQEALFDERDLPEIERILARRSTAEAEALMQTTAFQEGKAAEAKAAEETKVLEEEAKETEAVP